MDQALQMTPLDQILKRISDLKEIGKEEGVEISWRSKSDLLSFVNETNPSVRPLIALLDNGNLRALWSTEGGEQIGLQFRGQGEVQYVFFKKNADGSVSRPVGRCSVPDAIRLMRDIELWHVMRHAAGDDKKKERPTAPTPQKGYG